MSSSTLIAQKWRVQWWAKACDIGMHAAITYLILARGSGKDNRTASWSAEAVNDRTSITWRAAKKAIGQLVDAKLIRRDKAGSHPRYYIMPAHLVPGCEGYMVAPLTGEERALYSRLLKAKSKDG